MAYKNCYTSGEDKIDSFRPVFWFKDSDKREYEKVFGVVHSECYTKYGFLRTGCCCCPYGGRHLEHELRQVEKYEPKLYKAVNAVFKDSFEYTRQYYEFAQEMNARKGGQMTITNLLNR